ncbi:hypothetical protein CEXT_362861 [Caerostris extrusa]|uniref:Uncharacterized protein n=1 Tax=Caerostris extrusa TaxID=172846 RepID=A0AAV4PFC3_CAEEX|nr:hypothetical protein CEXT_362861 [Caerostris extrusa]
MPRQKQPEAPKARQRQYFGRLRVNLPNNSFLESHNPLHTPVSPLSPVDQVVSAGRGVGRKVPNTRGQIDTINCWDAMKWHHIERRSGISGVVVGKRGFKFI